MCINWYFIAFSSKKKIILLPKKVGILLNLFMREEEQHALEVVLLKYGTRQKTVL